METLAFTVPGDARGKGRPRASTRGGFARMYTDAKTRAYENTVRSFAANAMAGDPPLEGALDVSMQVRLAVPKSFSKRRRAAVLTGAEAYFGAFDADNLAKSILDGCNGTVFRDDRQVMSLLVVKRAAESAGVDIRICPHDGGSL